MPIPASFAALNDRARALAPGFGVALLIAIAARFIAEHYGGPTLLFALLFGMAFAFLGDEGRAAPGIAWSGKAVLRLGVALLGARIGLEELSDLGGGLLLLVAAALAATILFGVWMARRLGLHPHFGVLTGGATAICGASAALAISAVLPARADSERDTLFAVVAVTTLSTAAMIFYPILVTAVGFDDGRAGVFLGGTIHDVAQVVGAGYLISDAAGDRATLTKLFRVALLIPVTLILAVLIARAAHAGAADAGAARGAGRRRIALPALPWFLVAFVALAAVNSAGWLPPAAADPLVDLSRWCLVVAIAAIGLKTHLGQLREVGVAPLVLVVAETGVLAAIVMAGLLAGL